MVTTINDNLFYVGVNDRQKPLFENLWPLPHGVSYNSYLLKDEKNTLFDTVDICYADIFFSKLEKALQGEELHYLVINHMEPDHSGSLSLLKTKYPKLQIVGNARTLDMVTGYYGITEGLVAIKTGDRLSLGKHELQFFLTPMIHWPETMMTYEITQKVLFSGDAFGTFGALDGGVLDSQLRPEKYWDEMIRYYASIVGKYGSPVQKALASLAEVEIQTICSTHGPVWTQQENVAKASNLYNKMSQYQALEDGVVLAYGSMYGNTERVAECIAQQLAQLGIKDLVVHNITTTDHSYVLRDVFKYKNVILGCPTYNNQLYPPMEFLLSKLENRVIKHKNIGYFGSFTWSGAAVKRIAAFAETMKWNVMGTPVEMKYAPNAGIEEQCAALAQAVFEQYTNEIK